MNLVISLLEVCSKERIGTTRKAFSKKIDIMRSFISVTNVHQWRIGLECSLSGMLWNKVFKKVYNNMGKYWWHAKEVTYKYVLPVDHIPIKRKNWTNTCKKMGGECIIFKWFECGYFFLIFTYFFLMRENISIMENINYLKREKNSVDCFVLDS